MSKDDDGRWSYSAGHPPHTVRVYERKGSPNIYSAVWDPDTGREIKKSLGHGDRERAKEWADDKAPELRKGQDGLRRGIPTARRVLKLYRKHRSPDKSERVQAADERQAEMWRRFLGPDFDLRKLSRREWDSFIRKRRSGEIDGRARRKGDPDFVDGDGVGNRTLERDLRFLRAVCRWAMDFRQDDGRLLLQKDPTRGYDIPQEKNPKRPVASHDRVEAIRKVYRDVTMRVERGGKREKV